MHVCDNTSCVRPDHLRGGTQLDNIADMVAKNRQRKGEDTGTSKLTEAKVREIRARYVWRKTTQKMLAREYGVSQALVARIVGGNIWKWVAQ